MKLIQLTQGKFTMVDDEDYDFLMQWKWSTLKTKSNFYAVRSEHVGGRRGKCKGYCMHRVLLGVEGRMNLVDHKDGNGLNNQRSNLRPCTQSENMSNLFQKGKRNGTSIYKGVAKKGNVYCTTVTKNGVQVYRGKFVSEVDAAIAYNENAILHFGEFANINKLPHQMTG